VDDKDAYLRRINARTYFRKADGGMYQEHSRIKSRAGFMSTSRAFRMHICIKSMSEACLHLAPDRKNVCTQSMIVCMSASSAWQDAFLHKKHSIMSASRAWQDPCLHLAPDRTHA
jgi:hypothetical protein